MVLNGLSLDSIHFGWHVVLKGLILGQFSSEGWCGGLERTGFREFYIWEMW